MAKKDFSIFSKTCLSDLLFNQIWNINEIHKTAQDVKASFIYSVRMLFRRRFSVRSTVHTELLVGDTSTYLKD